MPKLFDLVKVNIATTGPGTVTFGAASSNAFWTPAEAGALDGDTVRYVFQDGLDREEGVGTIQSSVAQMVRTTVTRSKIGGVVGTAKINLSGSAVLAFIVSAADIANTANNLSDLASASAARTNLGLGDIAVKTLADVFAFSNATEATGAGTTYGARFAGGVEIAKKLFVTGAAALASTLAVAGALTATSTSDATSITAGGAFTSSGGAAIAKKLFVGDAASVQSASASALAVGLNGSTNPALQVDASTASSATGIKIKSAAAAAGAAVSVVSSGANENLTVDAKGSGTVTIGGSSTGAISLARNSSVTGTLGVSGDFAVATNKFTVASASGNTAVAGTLAVASATASTSSITGALTVAGGAGIGGVLSVATGLGVGLNYAQLGTGINAIGGSNTGQFVFAIQNSHGAVGDAGMLIAAGSSTSTDASTSMLQFYNSGLSSIMGAITRNGTNAVAYGTSSDIRGKPNRELLSPDIARSIVDRSMIWDFDKAGNAIRGIGVIAQEAHAVHPSLATPGRTPDAWWMAEKAGHVPFLVVNMQQANARLDAIEKRLSS